MTNDYDYIWNSFSLNEKVTNRLQRKGATTRVSREHVPERQKNHKWSLGCFFCPQNTKQPKQTGVSQGHVKTIFEWLKICGKKNYQYLLCCLICPFIVFVHFVTNFVYHTIHVHSIFSFVSISFQFTVNAHYWEIQTVLLNRHVWAWVFQTKTFSTFKCHFMKIFWVWNLVNIKIMQKATIFQQN